MESVTRVGDIEVDQDLPLERRMWKLQRIGWALMLLIAIAALLGLFGPGPLTRFTAGQKDHGLWVEYFRFERSESPSDIKINIGINAVTGSEARVWINRRYMEAIEVEKVTPEPDRVEIAADRFTYVFRLSRPGESTAVRFTFKPREFGNRTADIGLEGVTQVRFTHFVWP